MKDQIWKSCEGETREPWRSGFLAVVAPQLWYYFRVFCCFTWVFTRLLFDLCLGDAAVSKRNISKGSSGSKYFVKQPLFTSIALQVLFNVYVNKVRRGYEWRNYASSVSVLYYLENIVRKKST